MRRPNPKHSTLPRAASRTSLRETTNVARDWLCFYLLIGYIFSTVLRLTQSTNAMLIYYTTLSVSRSMCKNGFFWESNESHKTPSMIVEIPLPVCPNQSALSHVVEHVSHGIIPHILTSGSFTLPP